VSPDVTSYRKLDGVTDRPHAGLGCCRCRFQVARLRGRRLVHRLVEPRAQTPLILPIVREEQLGEVELLRRFGDDRNWFSVERPGSANRGHDFWSRIRTDANRRALIEYLKTL